MNQRFKKIQKDSKRFKKIQKDSKRFKKIQKDSKSRKINSALDNRLTKSCCPDLKRLRKEVLSVFLFTLTPRLAQYLVP